mmetsp:Transcript_14354/g.56491  ORF Transcript_14354/g.56491 Transcript_14354/m.56491 type:complete len:123 (+) Transcript_14354:52-420(+)
MCKILCFTFIVGLGIKGGKEGKTSTRVMAWSTVAIVGSILALFFSLTTYLLIENDPDGWFQWASGISAAFFCIAAVVGCLGIPVVLVVGARKAKEQPDDQEPILGTEGYSEQGSLQTSGDFV